MADKTIREMMEEMRQKSGAREYSGQGYMDLNRFAEDTRHMVIFDVLKREAPIGKVGERTRLYLTEEGYRKALDNQEKGTIKIISHAHVSNGHLRYDRKDQIR